MTVTIQPETLADVRLVDCDSHFTEPPDLWSSRAPASMAARMPQMRTEDGISSWYLDGNVLSSVPNPDLYWDTLGPQRRLAVLATQFYMSNARIIVNLCMSNIFDRYPNVKINSAESGIGWVPFILEAMEYQLDEMVTDADEVTFAQRRPTEYFRDHIFVTFWFEKVAPQRLIDVIGVNNVVVETDIPHPTCIAGNARERIAASVAGLDPAVQRRVLRENAIELFNLPTASA